jgi:dienelactone hydrolase
MGGHSLGGAMACKFAKDTKNMEFLILLGSYCADDVSNSKIKVLSIVGSEDGLLGGDKIDKYKTNLPKDTQFEIIEGMNHAQTGNYGDQLGDKQALSPDEFTRLRIVNTIKSFLNR